MTTHATEVVHSDHAHGIDPRLEIAKSLKFEATELHDFGLADKAAGQMMGKLLAFLFCVLLFLMTGVNIWMLTHSSTIDDKDPQAFINDDAAASHH